MSCSECTKFEICEIFPEVKKAHKGLCEVKYNDQTTLFENPQDFLQKREKRYMELRKIYFDLRRKQMKCLTKRIISQSKGYRCFRSQDSHISISLTCYFLLNPGHFHIPYFTVIERN